MATTTAAAPPSANLRMLWWLPRLAFLLFAVMLGALFWFIHSAEKEEERATLISDMLWLEQSLRFILNHNEELLAGYDPRRIERQEVFDAHASTLIGSNTGIVQVIWRNPGGTLRHALPPLDSADRAGRSDTAEPELARSLGHAVYGPPYPVTAGDWQFEIEVPIFRGDAFAGMAVGVYSVRRLLADVVPWWLAERYQISIVDQANQMLGQRSNVGTVEPGNEYQMPFDPPGHGLMLHAAPYQVPTALAGRLISAGLAVLAGLVLLSLWLLRRHVQRRLAAESALQAEVAFRKAMEDSVHTGLRARNLQGQITYVNPAFCQMVGWPAAELIGRMPPMPYWAEEYLDETRAMHAKVLAGEAPSEGFEIKFRRRNGEIFDALIHEAPLIDANGQHTGWMGSVVDITERKRAAELAHQQEERLQASARLVTMGEMASSLAHELNQPLSAISSYATGCRNLIAAGSDDCATIDAALAKCQEQAQRAGHIIRRIYDFARRHEPKSETCDLSALLTDLLALIEIEARRLQVRLIRHIAPALPPLQADRVLLAQAILNLLRNALEAMRQSAPNQRELTLAANVVERQVLISIADRGNGIASEDAPRLFEPFYTTKSEGLGVGLNICRSVVEAHHGRLWFAPNPGGGTVFFISLPQEVT